MRDVLRVGLADLDDAALVDALQRSPDAFGELYRRYESAVLAYFVRRVRRGDVAADLMAEVFAAALAGLRGGRQLDQGFAPWLFGIAHHKLTDSLRREVVEDAARRGLSMQPVVIGDEDLERIEALGEHPDLLDWVAQLPAAEREAVVARVLDERDYPDIAAELTCSQQVVRKRVSRGLARLRSQIEEAP